jgi:hypothetical protein
LPPGRTVSPEHIGFRGSRATHHNRHKDEPLDGTTRMAGQLATATLSRFSPPSRSKAQLQIEKSGREPARDNSDCFLQAIACL